MAGIAYTISNLAKRESLSVGDAILKHRELNCIEDCAEVFPDPRDPALGKLLVSVSDMNTPFEDDLTNGAIYFVDIALPLKDHEKALLNDPENHPLVSHIGSVKFFR